MTKNKDLFKSYANYINFEEDAVYQRVLSSITVFPYFSLYNTIDFYKGTLNLSLKNIEFNKKKALVFFFAMELLTNQKCVATLSSKNVLAWKLRKSALVGCKVTLRKKRLLEFLDTLFISFPRMENFKGVNVLVSSKKKSNVTQDFLNNFTFTLNELIMFYTIELGLGINTEVRKAKVQFSFTSYNRLEHIFLLTSSKIPVI